ncbi:MAG: hypothetical protein ACLP59_32370 [Bryobacteraceae bacterium]
MNAQKLEHGKRSGHEPAGDLWRHTLARIPTLFGRVLYLASLRNQASGEYRHPGLAQMVGDEEAGETLRRSHARVFHDWLCLNLEQQRADLQEYLAETPNPAAVLAAWADSPAYRSWAPSDAQEVEQRLFASDLQTLLKLLRVEYGDASPDPES